MANIIKDLYGVIYVAFERNFTDECVLSIRSLRRHHPNLRVHVFTDRPEAFEGFWGVTSELISPSHVRVKLNYLSHSPFEKTLYLDTDTLVCRNIGEIYEMLDRFDVLATHDYARKRRSVSDLYPAYRDIPYAFPEVNGGMLALSKSGKSQEFLQLWRSEYEALSGTIRWDQPSLRVALWKSKVRLAILPKEFNLRGKKHLRKAAIERKKNGGSFLQPAIVHLHVTNMIHKIPLPRIPTWLHQMVASLLRERLP